MNGWSKFLASHVAVSNEAHRAVLGGELPPPLRSLDNDNDNDDDALGQGAVCMFMY